MVRQCVVGSRCFERVQPVTTFLRREVLAEITSTERAGMMGINTMMVIPEGKGYSYAYSLPQHLSELHYVEGLK